MRELDDDALVIGATPKAAGEGDVRLNEVLECGEGEAVPQAGDDGLRESDAVLVGEVESGSGANGAL